MTDPQSRELPSIPSVDDPAAAAAPTFHSLYPNVLDPDALKYMQLRTALSDAHFYSVTWPAMKRAGWTYNTSGGTYRSPGKTRTWTQSNALTTDLDSCAILSPLHAFQQNERSLDSQAARQENNDQEEQQQHPESLVDLRNAVCYHIVLMAEKRDFNYQMESRSVNKDSPDDGANNDDEHYQDTAIVTNCRTHSKRSAGTNSSMSATVVDKGSDLYLHKNNRRSLSKKRKKELLQLANSSSSSKDLQLPNCNRPTMSQCAQIISKRFNVTACEALEAELANTREFAQWRHLLSTNHSLLLYGNGSKYNVLQQFCNEELRAEGYVLQINGCDPNVSIDAILDLFVTLFLNNEEPREGTHDMEWWDDCHASENNSCKTSVFSERPSFFISQGIAPHANAESTFKNRASRVDRAVRIARAIVAQASRAVTTVEENPGESNRCPIFLVIHSLEGPGLVTDQAQDALAALVSHSVIPCHYDKNNSIVSSESVIRLVASLDHVDASSALWSSETTARFNWFWKEIHTYRPYIRELDMLVDEIASVTKIKQKQARLCGPADKFELVLNSLAPHHAQVMKVLAQLQLSALQQHEQSSEWIKYEIFKRACEKSCIIDKEYKLRLLQTELMDHRLMASKTVGTSEFVCIPHSIEKLSEILAFQRGVIARHELADQ